MGLGYPCLVALEHTFKCSRVLSIIIIILTSLNFRILIITSQVHNPTSIALFISQNCDQVYPEPVVGSDEAKNGSGQQSLSKSALKKLAKRQSWLDTIAPQALA